MTAHVPALARSSVDGRWAVYCLACSDAAGDYVDYCEAIEHDGAGSWPPRVLADAVDLDRARDMAVRLEQQNGEALRILVDDPWSTSYHAAAAVLRGEP